ncbi:unnamed protein product [Laminaria digitata]
MITTATPAATAASATAGDGGVNAKAGKRKEPVEWGVYLRTPEDEERTKREWEKEHREWIEDQEEKSRLLAEEGVPPASSKKKRKYSASTIKTGMETFADVLQTEAAKNKSLKIDHAALQRVMNHDGSLKQVDEDDAMEEVFEDNLAPLPLMPPTRLGKGFKGRVKAPLTSAPSHSPHPSTALGLKPFAGGSVLPPARGSRAGAAGRGGGGGGASAGFGAGAAGDFDFKGGVVGRHAVGGAAAAAGKGQAVPPLPGQVPVKAAWARAAPNDGGEKAIKDALELLKMGGLTALPGISNVSAPAVAAPVAAAAAVTCTAPVASATSFTASTLPVAAALAAAVSEAPAVTERVAQQEEEEEEEEEDFDDEDDDDDGGMYGAGMDDDDDDPYGEEA